MMNIFKKITIFPITLYRYFLRPLLPNSCVFEPSCSEYTKQAIMKYGPIKGVFLGIKRILRCHPWQKKHWDPLV